MIDTEVKALSGPRSLLLLGACSAWTLASLYVLYVAVLFAGGVARGVPQEPYLAIAEILTIVGAALQVTLMATVHESAPLRAKVFSLTALGWTLIMATLTTTVHFVELTVGRRVDVAAIPGFARLFGWEWPSLLYGVELLAWHLCFGLSLLFAAPVFPGRGRKSAVRTGLRVTGGLCLLGLVGPVVGNLKWRMIGAFAYGFIFPVVCFLIGLVFRDAAAALSRQARPRRA